MNAFRTIRQWVRPEVKPVDLSTHISPLDGVRGLAVLMVLCYDCLKLPSGGGPLTLVARKLSGAGFTGVDLFFVLSGFLITGILLDTKGRAGYWKSFMMRRAVRIFPLYYLTLLGVFVLIPALAALGVTRGSNWIPQSLIHDQIWYWTYAQNWLFAFNTGWPEDRVLNHFWSLAVEEQFYLLWPLVVALLSRKGLSRFCIGVCVLALALRSFLVWNSGPSVACYVMTITRADSLCMGALLAMFLRSPERQATWGPRLPLLLLGSATTLIAIDSVFPVLQGATAGAYSIGHTLFGITFVALIGSAALVPQTHPLARFFSTQPMLQLGKYSYAIYVFHRAVHAGVKQLPIPETMPVLHSVTVFALTIACSVAAAQLSWRLVERPALSLKRFFPRPDEMPAETTTDHTSVLSLPKLHPVAATNSAD